MLVSCDEIESIIQQPEVDVVAGLKEALEVGTDSATSSLSSLNGYLGDEAVKILLPEDMQNQINAFKAFNINIPGFNSTISGSDVYENGLTIPFVVTLPALADFEKDLITGVNRAAESAATEAAPIFVNAITSMTFDDANEILFGSDSAATQFFIDNTYDNLFSVYEPKLDLAISSVKIGNSSVEDLYASYVNTYNDIITTDLLGVSISSLTDLTALENPDLSMHATNKGLDGLFLKVKEQEAEIRNNPLARVTQLLEDVFGLQD